MTANRTKEDRKHRRISLEQNDGVYCIVVRALSAGKTITLPAMDFSESGFRFAIVSHMIKDFFEGEKIFLKAIAGSRNLTFKDPLELEVRWRKYDSSRTWVVIGCQIVKISDDAKVQFLKFIEAEERFRGIGRHGRLNGGALKIDSIHQREASEKDSQKLSRTILTISGGSPQNSSLERVLNWVEDELRTSGHHVERVDLLEKAIIGCDGCGRCNGPVNEQACPHTDEVQSIFDKLVASDVVIYASPLYFWGFSSQLKALIDRCHCLFRGRSAAAYNTSCIEGQRQALVVTTSEPFDNNAEPILTIFNRMLDRCKARSAGTLFVCNCSLPDALGEDIKAQSIKFAKNLFGGANTPYPVLIPGGEQKGAYAGGTERLGRKGLN